MKKLIFFIFLCFVLKSQAYTIQKDSILQGKQAESFLNNSEIIRLYSNTKIPAFVKWKEGHELSREQVISQIHKWGNWNDDFSLKLMKVEQDELGMKHERYQQEYQGIPVFGGNYIFHIKGEKVVSVNGLLFNEFNTNGKVISEKQSFDAAKKFMNATVFKWELDSEESHLKMEQDNPNATYFPKTEIIIVPENGDFYKSNGKYVLCYAYDIYAHQPLDRKKVFVNASNGNVEFYDQLLQHSNDTGIANTGYSGTQTIVSDSTGPVNFRLRETTRGLGVETWNLLKGTSYAAAVDFLDSNNIWNNFNVNLDQYATDAHWGLEMTYDYFWLKHNRNSINNAGFKLINYIHYSSNYTNAFWDGIRMTYGDGAPPYTPLVAMDIVAHELTHGLTSNTSNLVYSYESGALNESFSDIFGVSVDFYSRPALANYLMGDGIGGTPFRSMSNPNAYNDPDTYLGAFWWTAAGDNGGVHTNSGVQNYWYYLMVNGGTGVNDIGNAFSVTGMGLDTASKITFRNNTVYLVSSSQYADARFYAIQSAADLYGICSEPVKNTTNAWYAVGVGPKWDTTLPVSFTAAPTSGCVIPSTHSFINTSNNATFQWYFGDGGTSTLTSPVYNYNSFGTYTVKLVATCGIKKDSLIKTNYINITPAVPVVFSRTSDTIICEKTSITLNANTNLGAPTWIGNGITDSVNMVTPLSNSIYYFTKNNLCQTFQDSIKVTVLKTPTINSATASAASICLGMNDTLNATSSLRTDLILQLGVGTTTSATNGNTPYNRTWEGNRTQWIVRASELTALGGAAGPIKSLQFNVTTVGTGVNNQKNFTIKIGNTAQTTMGASWATIVGGFTQVYGPTNISNPSLGWNNYNFAHPFYWDGISNIIIEICHDNDLNNTCPSCFSPNPAIQYSTLTYNAVYSNYSDNAQRCGTSGGTTTGYTLTRRPNMKFGFFPLQTATASTNWNWIPGNISTATAIVGPSTQPISTYKVIATTPSLTCKDSASVNINVLSKPTLLGRTDTTICAGSSVDLTASGTGGTIIWNPGGLIGPSVNVTPANTTVYIASISNGFCTTYDTVNIIVQPVPTIIARTDSTLCFGQSINLTAVSNIGPITWTPGGMVGSPVLVTPASTMDYIASVSNVCGIKRDTVKITIIPIPNLIARNDSAICNGSSINLTAISNISPITWSPGGMVGSPVLVSPSSSTMYLATVSNVCGTVIDTVNITVIPVPTLLARADTTICNGSLINLTAVSNISPITWSPGGMTGSPVLVNPGISTSYIATSSNSCGIAKDTVNITVIVIPTLVTRMDTTICQGNIVALSALSNITPIVWNPGNLNGSPVNVSPSVTTNYIATVNNVCGSKSDSVVINVIPQPTLVARADTTICKGNTVILFAATNMPIITWNPGSVIGNNLPFVPSSTTNYIAMVQNVCATKIDTVIVTVIDKPNLVASYDTTICVGNSVSLSASSNHPVIWNPGAINGFNIIVNPNNTANYYATSQNVCGVSIDTVKVNVIQNPTVVAMNDSTICFGGSIKLFAYSSLGIVWNPGNLTNLSIVNPTNNSQFIAQVSNACGVAKDTVNINIVPLPFITAMKDTVMCPNNNLLITSNSNANVVWTPGNISGNNLNVLVNSSQTYIATATNMCGNKSDTVLVVMLPIPIIIARQDTSLCVGSNVQMYANSNINNYNWNPGSLNVQNFSINPTSNISYIVSSQNKCGISKDTVNISTIPMPIAILPNDTFICRGDSINLFVKGIGNFTWNNNSKDSMIRVSPQIVTNYSVVADNACGSAFDVMKVDVISKPKANAIFAKDNLSVNFTNNSVGAQTYLWIFGDGKTDTSISPIHKYTQIGNVKAKLIAFNICGNDTFEMNYFVSTIKEIKENNIFVVHPNPAKEYVMIDWSENIEVKKVKVFNAIGQEMILDILYSNYRVLVNTNSLASGIYQLHIIGDNSNEIQQIIVER